MTFDARDYPFVTVTEERGSGLVLTPQHTERAQFFYVSRGSGRFRFGLSVFDASRGDVFYLPPETLFSAVSDDGISFYRIGFSAEMLFADFTDFDNDILEIFRIKQKYAPLYFKASEAVTAELSAEIRALTAEWGAKDLCYRLLLRASVYRLMATVIRHVGRDYIEDRALCKNILRLRPVIDYVGENYGEKIRIRDLSALTDVGEDHFEKLFREAIGFTPYQYVTYIRLRYAARMLIDESMSVAAVSRACGFSSSAYFSRSFFAVLGCSPQEYRTADRIIKPVVSAAGTTDLLTDSEEQP